MYLGWLLSQWSSGDWRDFLFCMSPTQSTPPTISAGVYLRTWPSAYPNPLPLLFSPFAVSLPPTPSLFSPSITPSHHHPSVCFPDSSTLLLFFFFTLYSLDFTCLFPPSNHPSFSSSSLLLFFSPPREKYGSDEHGEPGTNQSIDLSMYPSLCPSDRQQKTKCLLSETFPISFFPSPRSLGNGEPVSGTCPPSWDLSCLPITFL